MSCLFFVCVFLCLVRLFLVLSFFSLSVGSFVRLCFERIPGQLLTSRPHGLFGQDFLAADGQKVVEIEIETTVSANIEDISETLPTFFHFEVELLDLLGEEGIHNLPLLERLQQLDQTLEEAEDEKERPERPGESQNCL